MQKRASFTAPIIALALVASALGGASGTAAQEESAAAPEAVLAPHPVEVSFSGPNLVVEPRVPGVATSVYVSCADGTYIHREFAGVGAALVELVRPEGAYAAGSPVADGRCKYEVYVHPPVDKEAMRAAEEAGDWATVEHLSRIEQEQTVISHGLFQVAEGIPVAALTDGSDQ